MQWMMRGGVLLAVVGVLLACRAEPPPPEPVVRPIKMLEIGGGLEGTREYPGRIRAAQQINMAFEVAGRIIEFVYPEGQVVETGSILARLDPRDYQNALEQALAVARQARTYRDRLAQARKTGAIPEQDLTDAQAQLEVAQAEVKIRRKAVDDTRLVAPFDGRMSRKLVEDFANVLAKESVLVYEDTSHLQIRVAVPERDLAGRRPADTGLDAVNARIRPEVMVSALPDERFPARLTELASTADPTTRTYQGTFTFDSPLELIVLPGMTARVIIHLSSGERLGNVEIPAHAAVSDPAGQATVWLVDRESQTVRRHPVTLGEIRGNDVVIREGLSSGDVVAISGVAQLREGMEVSRWEARPQP